MTYDEAIKRLEQIMTELESDEAISMALFKEKAKEAKSLIEFCQKELQNMETELQEIGI